MAGHERMKAMLAVCAGLAVAGCGSDDSDEQQAAGISESTAQALSGIYELTRFTRNDAACDAEGPVATEVTEGFFVVQSSVVIGQRILQIASCSSLENCSEKAIQIRNLGTYSIQYSFTLSRELDASHVAGFSASTGFSEGNMCTGREYSDHALTVNADRSVQLESRTKLLADRPQEDGFCMVRPAESKQEAQGRPCTTLEVLAGTRVADF